MAGVKTTHPSYSSFAKKWKRCRDAVAGQDAVHAGKVAYLPRLKDQSDDDYKAYVMRAGYYNATWRTISGLLGMMFRKPPAFDRPAALEPYLEDVTMSGVSFDTFAREIACEVLEVGRVGILVDHPVKADNVEAVTVAGAQSLGLRPMLQMYAAESIINWKYRRINNQQMLSMVVLSETIEQVKDEFESEQVSQYRVLDLDEAGEYRVRVFQSDKHNKDVLISEMWPQMNGSRLREIPFVVVGSDGNLMDLDEPPLIDLVDLNLSHYRTNADYEHGCHFTGLPTAVVSGYSPESEGEKLYIGSAAAWVFPDPNAKAHYLEFTGQGLGALKENLDRKESQMAVLGARMLAAEKKQAETATTAAIHRTGENSILASIALALGQSLTHALTLFSQWGGISGAVSYELNRDYMPVMMDASQLTALMGLVQNGNLSEQSFFDLLQRGDIIDAGLTFEDEQARIDAAPALEVAV